MNRYAMALLVALSFGGSAHAAMDNKAAEEMMKRDGCSACHSIEKKGIGPAYKDVAAKYKGDKEALARLSAKVKKGGSGVWGQTAMPPNYLVKDEDINQLVTWILTLNQ
jgi:cytochrome c